MNFLFDLIASQPNADGEFHGGGKYAKKVFLSLCSFKKKDFSLFAIYSSAQKLDAEIEKAIAQFDVQLIDIEVDTIPVVIADYGIQRFYSALPFGLIRHGLYEAFQSDCQIYCTVHGLRNLEIRPRMSDLHYHSAKDIKGLFRTFFKGLLDDHVVKRDFLRCRKIFGNCTIFTVSDHTKFSIFTYFPEIKRDIEVFYSPDVTEFEGLGQDEEVTAFHQTNYFLLVSGNRWLKNNMRSVLALDSLFTDNPEITQHVVITGVTHPEVFLHKIRNKDRFTFYKYVSESFLHKLYKNAYAFIYMTLNEGFGYPPLDAMKNGTPVLTSPVTSIPEICGDAVLYANPYSIEEIKNRILQLCDQAVYMKLTVSSIQRYKQVSERQKRDLHRMLEIMIN